MLNRFRAFALSLLVLCSGATAATLLPPGVLQFLDNNGNPLSGGTVTFYIPGTTTPKDTYQDAGGTVLNANPLTLDSAGRGVIYGVGAYREVVKDSLGNTIYDQLTADTSSSNTSWGGHSGGSANAQTVSAANFTSGDGQVISFIAGFSNSTATTLNPSGAGGLNILKDLPTGSVSLTGGEIVAGNVVSVIYDATLGAFHLASLPPPSTVEPFTTVASATTTDLGAAATRNITITGTTGITSFGSSASTNNPIYRLNFAGALTLTHNATSLILPGAANITTAAGDAVTAMYLGSGNWRVISYTTAASRPLLQSGGTMTGAIAMGSSKITGLGTPTTGTDAATKAYADSVGLFARGTTTGGGAVTAGYNIASATASSGGVITWTFTNAASSATSYVCVATASAGAETATQISARTSTTISTYTTQVSGAGTVAGVDLLCFGS